jgi:hypothetical protein
VLIDKEVQDNLDEIERLLIVIKNQASNNKKQTSPKSQASNFSSSLGATERQRIGLVHKSLGFEACRQVAPALCSLRSAPCLLGFDIYS